VGTRPSKKDKLRAQAARNPSQGGEPGQGA
jgi:hypothetical protein